jgi:glycosyltransferase involved in cell wall biosynthesis
MGSYISKRDILHRFTYANVDRVLAISEVIRKNVLETTTMPPDRVLTLHHAIDTDFFSPRQGNRARVRAQFGYDERNVVVGFVGRFSPGKGHEDLLNAIPLVRPQCPALRVLVVGEASYGEHPYAESIRSLSHNLGLDAIVTFAGYRSDVPDIMASFDILAFPSHAESFGVVLIEAMAMERPVVSTNCDGVIDIVVDGRTGIFVEPRNPRQLASALLRLIEDPALRDRMGKEGRKRVVDLFDRRKQIDRLEAVYEEVLKPVTHLPAARS